MPTRRAIRGVLGNFLGTYTSRYTDFDGYWLFGFLVGDFGELRIDLLTPTVGEANSALGVAVRSAAVKFEDQVRKAGLAISQVREAQLTIRWLPDSVDGSVNGHPCVGYNLNFLAEAVMCVGSRYEKTRLLFVAPHDATVELQNTRAAQPGGTHRRAR